MFFVVWILISLLLTIAAYKLWQSENASSQILSIVCALFAAYGWLATFAGGAWLLLYHINLWRN